MNEKFHIESIFPVPIYQTLRLLDHEEILSREKNEIQEIIDSGLTRNQHNSLSKDTYIFNSRLKDLKNFLEIHIRNYVDKIICPKNDELTFYMTQSWLNIVPPGGFITRHDHSNSIISGVFYVLTEQGDNVNFFDSNLKIKQVITISSREQNIWNGNTFNINVHDNLLLLFPSWIDHSVGENVLQATRNRLSIAFNVCCRGTIGDQSTLSELILK